jgi:hypothetical protein
MIAATARAWLFVEYLERQEVSGQIGEKVRVGRDGDCRLVPGPERLRNVFDLAGSLRVASQIAHIEDQRLRVRA